VACLVLLDFDVRCLAWLCLALPALHCLACFAPPRLALFCLVWSCLALPGCAVIYPSRPGVALLRFALSCLASHCLASSA
jgi:hypothetical protein